MKRFACCIVLICVFVLPSSLKAQDWLGRMLGVDKAINELRQDMNETRKAVKEAIDVAAIAVPGERWLRLIDNLHSSDPAKQKEAREFLSRLMKMDPDDQFQATLSFRFTANKPFVYDVFRTHGRDPSELKHFAENVWVENRATSAVLFPADESALRAHITKEMQKTLIAMHGQPQLGKAGPIQVIDYPSGVFAPKAASNPDPGVSLRERSTERDRLAEQFASAILSAYSYNRNRVFLSPRSMPWKHLESAQSLTIMVTKETLEAHGDDFAITASVHKVGEPDKTLNARPPKVFQRADFVRSMDSPLRTSSGVVLYYATHTMSDDIWKTAGPAAASELEALRRSVSTWGEPAKK